jgi:hypothetical protein
MMDMAADDAMHVPLPRPVRNRLCVVYDKVDRVFDLEFEVSGKRPVRVSKAAADNIERVI